MCIIAYMYVYKYINLGLAGIKFIEDTFAHKSAHTHSSTQCLGNRIYLCLYVQLFGKMATKFCSQPINAESCPDNLNVRTAIEAGFPREDRSHEFGIQLEIEVQLKV